ncbi:optineurin-like isoform X2 [Sitophilus oryzae]|uniref:Optineurin-like isoform X2 n=1 Tax=Sitophilus oryzae TaxID=7048 RepID=A0A6J2YPN9_SITOR|nr:optineurin-like isoform X2 [Sitophilus oryzae]
MATSNIGTTIFNIPPEPKPVPTLNSDEESFVILGKSLEGLLYEEDSGTSIILEAKQLLKEELEKISLQVKEQELKNGHQGNPLFANGVNEKQPSVSDNKVDLETSQCKFHTANFEDKNYHSTALPTMPSHLAVADETNKAISIISFAPNEFQSEELQNKVSQLIEENVNLKDTIIQNNNSMKAQYERIVAWQSEVEKVHQTHKEKFMKAKECIETLKKENASLQLEVENLKEALRENQQLVQNNGENVDKIELDKAKNEIKELKEVIENVTLKNAEAINIEVGKQTLVEQKLANYEEALEDAYKTIKELKANKNLELASLGSLKVLEEKSQKEIVSLQTQLAKSLQHSDTASRLSYELEQAKYKITELEQHREINENHLKEANNRCDVIMADKKALSESICALTKVIDDKQNELCSLKQQLSDKNLELQGVVLQLKSQYKQQQSGVDNEQVANLRQQLMQAQKAYTECNQAKVQLQAQSNKLQTENYEFSQKLLTKQEEEDTLYALKAQLEVYKSDFEAEREAKEDIKREKLKLSEDLQNLHRRNIQMQEEIELYREQVNQFHPVSTTRRGEEARSNSGSDSPPLSRYTCPICNLRFRSLKLVQDHLETCICHDL